LNLHALYLFDLNLHVFDLNRHIFYLFHSNLHMFDLTDLCD
jgi:hypothetical protein